MFSTKRLKKKSQSVDIPDEGYAGSLLTDPLASPIIPSVSRAAIAEETESSISNIQKSRSPRRGELKRGYTIDAGQKRSALERKDVRRISFQRPRGTMEYVVESRDTLNSIALKFDTTPNELVQLNKLFSRAVVPGKVLYVPDPEYMSSADSSPSLSPISPLSPSSSEADLDKTAADSDDVRRRQSAAAHGPPRHARVVSSTSEEEEALTEKFLKMNCKYITDGKGAVSGILLVTPNNIMFDPHKSDRVVQQRGCEEYGIMCPLEEVQSAAMCREVTDARVRELVPADLQLEACAGEQSHVKRTPRLDNDSTSTAPRSTEASLSEEVFTESEDEPPQVRPSQTVLTISHAQPQPAQENATPDATSGSPGAHAEALEGPAEDPDTPQDTCDTQEAESSSPANQIKAEEPHSTEPGRCRSHRFLCLRVGRAMRKTFLSHASASMQQYAQRDRKHEYWFAVPAERSDHLYAFFIQWTPDMYGEGLLGGGREPGFVVVKKNQSQTPDPESADPEKPSPDITFKDWEVVSVTEYYRRIDALNSEDLRSLCKRLQITTKEEVNSKLLLKSEPEPESFRPSLTQPSDLLQPDQIEKLAKHLPPRTIGYPWSLAFSTSQHGMSIKSLYRAMQELDSPVLMVIKDSEGQMFGALASEPLKVSDGFYGTGETFLFTFSPDLQVFKWTGDNLFFMKGDMDSVAFGGGGGEFGLWLDGDLYHGRTSSCKTFNSPMLSQTEDFYVQDIEIWAFE